MDSQHKKLYYKSKEVVLVRRGKKYSRVRYLHEGDDLPSFTTHNGTLREDPPVEMDD